MVTVQAVTLLKDCVSNVVYEPGVVSFRTSMLPPVPPERLSVSKKEMDVTEPATGQINRLYRCIEVVSVSLLIGM